jgi:hypothetical protein
LPVPLICLLDEINAVPPDEPVVVLGVSRCIDARFESVLTVVDGKIAYGPDDFGPPSPSPIPFLPDRSPVKEYGGRYRSRQGTVGDPFPHRGTNPNGLHALLLRLFGQHGPRCEEPLWGLGCDCFAFWEKGPK